MPYQPDLAFDATRVRRGESSVEGAGAGLFAERKVAPGEIVFAIDDPLVLLLDSKNLVNHCYRCLRQGDSPVFPIDLKTCTGCKLARFCSQSCYVSSWQQVHKFECKSMGDITSNVPQGQSAPDVVPTAARAAAQILLRRQHGQLVGDSYKAVTDMRSNTDHHMPPGSEKAGNMAMFSKGLQQLMHLTGSLGLVTEMLSRIQTNAQSVQRWDMEPIALLVDPRYACINHSCTPNAVHIVTGRTVRVLATEPIKKGDEIFITYTDKSYSTRVRQSALKEQYNFVCSCQKCQQGVNHTAEKLICTKCGKIEAVIKEGEIICASCDYRSEKVTARTIYNLEDGSMSELETNASASTLDVTSLISAAHTMLATKMWPLHRQPLADVLYKIPIATSDDLKDMSMSFCFFLADYLLISPLVYALDWYPARFLSARNLVLTLSYLEEDLLAPYLGKYVRHDNVAALATHLYQVCDSIVDRACGPDSLMARYTHVQTAQALSDAPPNFKLNWGPDVWKELRTNVERELRRRLSVD